MTLRVALCAALAALALALLPSVAVAQSPSDRFCLMPLTFPQNDGYLIQHYLVGAHPEHDLLVPVQRSDHPILQRRGSTLVPISDRGDALYAYGDVASTPDGGIYGIGGDLRLLALLRFDQVARHFRPVPAAQPPGYVSARTMGWSTPLNALLIADGGRGPRDPLYNPVWTLTDDTLTRVQGFEREDWITYIADFPDVNLTVLITEDDKTVYIIGADQTLHRLGDLAEARTRSIAQVRFLPDPPRLMFETRNLNHLFQLRLTQEDGIWQPADRQVRDDLLASIENDILRGFPRGAAFVSASQTYFVHGYRFDTVLHRWRARYSQTVRQNARGLFRLQGGTLVEVHDPDPDLLATLPYTAAWGLEPHTSAQHAIDLGFGLTLDLSSEPPMVRDPSGTLHPLAGADALQAARGVHGPLSPIPARDVLPIAERAATLVQVNRAAFLLFDRHVAGEHACDTSP